MFGVVTHKLMKAMFVIAMALLGAASHAVGRFVRENDDSHHGVGNIMVWRGYYHGMGSTLGE